jgi:hypothetical protein
MSGAQDSERRPSLGPSRILHRFWKSRITGVVACMLILAPHVGIAIADERDAILSAVRAYMMAIYARDYVEAYRWISEADGRLKSILVLGGWLP